MFPYSFSAHSMSEALLLFNVAILCYIAHKVDILKGEGTKCKCAQTAIRFMMNLSILIARTVNLALSKNIDTRMRLEQYSTLAQNVVVSISRLS